MERAYLSLYSFVTAMYSPVAIFSVIVYSIIYDATKNIEKHPRHQFLITFFLCKTYALCLLFVRLYSKMVT